MAGETRFVQIVTSTQGNPFFWALDANGSVWHGVATYDAGTTPTKITWRRVPDERP